MNGFLLDLGSKSGKFASFSQDYQGNNIKLSTTYTQKFSIVLYLKIPTEKLIIKEIKKSAIIKITTLIKEDVLKIGFLGILISELFGNSLFLGSEGVKGAMPRIFNKSRRIVRSLFIMEIKEFLSV